MADIKRKMEAMEAGSEERKMSVREWRRLKRLPQGSVPWPSAAQKSSVGLEILKDCQFLTKARQLLHADHFR